MSDDNKILSSKSNGVGTLTFNNPERLNAMSREMTRAAAEVMENFAADPEVRVVIVTGAGKKAFISGGDISKFEKARATPEQLVEYNKDSARFRVALRGIGKPTIAMIRGWCLGGGLAVALNCDLRICTEDSHFGVPAARLGIGYGAESLGQLVELMFTARRYTAAEALRIGLVNQVVQANMLEDFVHSYAATMVDNAPLSIIAAKRIVDEYVKDEKDRDTALMAKVVADCFGSQDYIEGRRAFMEKRRPVFVGK
jgi:enoyl-CoA hydratase/carnithine racemase